MLQHGDPAGTAWRPGETDVSIRPGWFHHPAEDERVKTVDELVELYFTSVGRNSKLLLNVPPTRDGLLHDSDAMRGRIDGLLEDDLALRPRTSWRRPSSNGAEAELDLGRTVTVGAMRLEEDIERGQVIGRYTLFGSDGGDWKILSSGTTIGYARLDRFPPTDVRKIRLVVEDAVASPEPVRIRLYAGEA
jgi:alpha-L-fucosidase